MGYDITFHSISKSELRRYVFDVLDDPSCAESRSKEVSSASEKCAKIWAAAGSVDTDLSF